MDFRAPPGTPVLALGDGKVVDIIQCNCVSGIHVKNLFLWNSVMLQLDDGMFVEYHLSFILIHCFSLTNVHVRAYQSE